MNLFSYQMLSVQLMPQWKTLRVSLKKPHSNSLCPVLLHELQDILNWCVSHLEVKTLLLDSKFPQFSIGFDEQTLQNFNREEFKNFYLAWRKLIFSMLYLPQTVVVDYQYEASGVGFELGFGADIRVCQSNAKLALDQLKKGLVPTGGGLEWLAQKVGECHVRNWLFSAQPININKLEQSGFIFCQYQFENRENILNDILKNLSELNPICRIQAKRALLEEHLIENSRFDTTIDKINLAVLSIDDWKNTKKWTDPREFSRYLKNEFQ